MVNDAWEIFYSNFQNCSFSDLKALAHLSVISIIYCVCSLSRKYYWLSLYCTLYLVQLVYYFTSLWLFLRFLVKLNNNIPSVQLILNLHLCNIETSILTADGRHRRRYFLYNGCNTFWLFQYKSVFAKYYEFFNW